MENTFWNRDGKFLELFEKSFALYVETGMRKKMEAGIGTSRNQGHGGCPVTKEFKAKFCKLITKCYLRKFHFF